jgi:hypothetical protein
MRVVGVNLDDEIVVPRSDGLRHPRHTARAPVSEVGDPDSPIGERPHAIANTFRAQSMAFPTRVSRIRISRSYDADCSSTATSISTPLLTSATDRVTNHLSLRACAGGDFGCSLMGGLPALHVNTTLLILINALYADARLCKASPAPTKKQAREYAARCASRRMRGGGCERDRTCRQLRLRRTMPRHAS